MSDVLLFSKEPSKTEIKLETVLLFVIVQAICFIFFCIVCIMFGVIYIVKYPGIIALSGINGAVTSVGCAGHYLSRLQEVQISDEKKRAEIAKGIKAGAPISEVFQKAGVFATIRIVSISLIIGVLTFLLANVAYVATFIGYVALFQ